MQTPDEHIRQQRWVVAQNLIERWWSPFEEQDQVTPAAVAEAEARLGVTLPGALREWYRLAGRRQDFIGNTDPLLPPEELAWIGNVLVFCFENQHVVVWGIRRQDLMLLDPPVLVDLGDPDDYRAVFGDEEAAAVGPQIDGSVDEEGSHAWFHQATTLSEFLLAMLIQATLYSSHFTGEGVVTSEDWATLLGHYESFGKVGESFRQMYADQDTLIQHTSRNQDIYLTVAARNRQALDRFIDMLCQHRMKFSHHTNYSIHHLHDACQDVAPVYITHWERRDLSEEFPDWAPCDPQ
jgi:hypothetical protein